MDLGRTSIIVVAEKVIWIHVEKDKQCKCSVSLLRVLVQPLLAWKWLGI